MNLKIQDQNGDYRNYRENKKFLSRSLKFLALMNVNKIPILWGIFTALVKPAGFNILRNATEE